MLLSFSLSQNIECQKICNELQRIITIYQKSNSLEDSVIVIDIKKITNDSSLIPKLEYKNNQS